MFVLVGYLLLRVKRLEFGNDVQDKLNDTIYTPVAILVVDNLKNQALHTIEVPQIVFDNLERLNIVTVNSLCIIFHICW